MKGRDDQWTAIVVILRHLIFLMQRNDLPLDVYMLNGLMKASQLSLGDKKFLLQLMDDQDIHPTQYFLKTMHGIISHARERIRRVVSRQFFS